jgi:chloramphenicol-sensitive protein RarD
VSQQRTGLLAGLGAYLLWGLFPLYWPLLEPSAPVEILAHRIVWSLLLLVGLLAVGGGFGYVRRLGGRRVALLAAAAALITVNWGMFIYGVTSGHVVETSLGYFINPLVTVALAVGVLRERLRRPQMVAVGVAALAVLVLTVDYGRPPWIALTLAFSFGLYGLVKKQVGVGGLQSLTVETAFVVLPAAGYLVWLGSRGESTFLSEGAGHAALLAGGGVATAVPLILFGAAAVRVPLVTVGVLQYLAPVMQFVIGVAVYGEPMPLTRLAGFALVWAALVIFAVDAVRAAREGAAAPDPLPTEPGEILHVQEPDGRSPTLGPLSPPAPAVRAAPPSR